MDKSLGHGNNIFQTIPKLVTALYKFKVVHVTCGSYHTAAVTSNGDLYTWGGGMYGKLGHNSESCLNTPCKVKSLNGVTLVACGSRHTVCLVGNDEVYAWGEKRNGVTGLGTRERSGIQLIPRKIPADFFFTHENTPQDFAVKELVACGFHTILLCENGEVYTWGDGIILFN